MLNLESTARFGFAYVPEQPSDALTVRDVVRDSLDILGLTTLLCGVTAIVALLGFMA